MSFQLGSVNKQYNAVTETFRTSFKLTHEGDSVFKKEFDGSSTSDVLTGSNTFVIDNHFYRTGEKLIYQAGPGNSPVNIDPVTSPGVGAATTLPLEVYAIKVAENKFKVAAARSFALQGQEIDISSVGIGTSHAFFATKANTKAIVALDNIIQSPVYPNPDITTTLVSIASRIVNLTDSGKLKQYDFIKINDEIMRVQINDYNGIENQVLVDRGYLGTPVQGHIAGDVVTAHYGDYNIVGDEIYFAGVPFGGFRFSVGISSNTDVDIDTDSFISNIEILDTGSRMKLQSLSPPTPLDGNGEYYLIKNSENSFSLAANRDDALTGIAITITSAGIGTHKLTYIDEDNGSSFQGRAFTRSDYTGNIIIDDLAQDFTGIAKTFTITENNANTIGITSDFGAILINNIFQKPEVDYEFLGGSSTGITSIRFTGKEDFPNEIYSLSDVNANRLPRKGIIVSLANSEGFGYQQQNVGYGTAVVSGFGTVTVSLGFTGSGYRNGPTTYGIRILGGNPTSAAAGTFTVAEGHIEDVYINTPGVGYTWTNVPIVEIDQPIPYDDIELISSSTGVGASVSLQVGLGLSVYNFELNNLGYGYTVGEQLRIAGIPTDVGIGTTFANSIFTVQETRDDEGGGWVFGKLQVLDDFSNEFNGVKKTFSIREDGEIISIQKRPGSLIDLDQTLLIFINDIIQKPGHAYTFEGGSKITFTEPPVEGSSLQILFYRGTDSDVTTDSAVPRIKIGDGVTIRKNRQTITPLSQDQRIVTDIINDDTIETTLYTRQGISDQEEPLRPIKWCKQQTDLIVGGTKISKSRPEYAAKIGPSARLIAGLSTDATTFYTNAGSLIFSKTEAPDTAEFKVTILEDHNETGFGSTTFSIRKETINEVSVVGDEGIIAGIGSTDRGVQFEFFVPLSSPLRLNEFGGITRTGIATGDYFIVSHSNVGNGLTALSQDRSTTVGIATTCIDGVYEVSHIDVVGTGTMRVYTNVAEGHGLNFTGIGSGVGNVYGRYSWARFSSSRTVGLAYTCNTENGLTGLATAAQVIRTTNILNDYS